MVKRRRSVGSSGWTVRATKKKKTGLNKRQAVAVKRLIKQQAKKADELKHFAYASTLEAAGDGVGGGYSYYRSYNIFYHNVTRGTGDTQFLGDKLRWKGIAVKYKIINGYVDTGGIVYSDQPILMDVMIIKAPEFHTTTSLPAYSLFNSTTNDYNLYFTEPGIKVLAKKTIKITPQKAGDKIVKTGKLWLRRDQTVEFKDFDQNSRLKDGNNYYLYFMNRSQNATRTYIGFAYQNYFVDS